MNNESSLLHDDMEVRRYVFLTVNYSLLTVHC